MSLNKKLREIAEVLPPLPQLYPNGTPKMRTVSRTNIMGSEILKQEPDAKVNGKDVIPNKSYLVSKKEYVLENHSKRLIDIKKKFGLEGLRQYISLCYTWNKMEIPEGVFEGVS